MLITCSLKEHTTVGKINWEKIIPKSLTGIQNWFVYICYTIRKVSKKYVGYLWRRTNGQWREGTAGPVLLVAYNVIRRFYPRTLMEAFLFTHYTVSLTVSNSLEINGGRAVYQRKVITPLSSVKIHVTV